jgi:hypothetical protein
VLLLEGTLEVTKKIQGAAALAELPLLTLAQTAEVTQTSVEHVRRKYRAGELPGAVRVAGVVRVKTSELLAAGGAQ